MLKIILKIFLSIIIMLACNMPDDFRATNYFNNICIINSDGTNSSVIGSQFSYEEKYLVNENKEIFLRGDHQFVFYEY